MGGRGREKRSADGARDLHELVGSSARRLQITGSQQDLDRSRKHPRTNLTSLRVEQDTPDGCGGGFALTLGKAKERQSGLRLSSALVCARVRRFRLRELTTKSMDLAQAVERGPRCWSGCQQLTGVLRVLRGIIPAATQLHDFRAIEETLAAVADEIGLSGTPSCERRRPLVRA